ncbi:EVE domain-containing protein [bacterium]|nr:EVE domain-containing protein [bacterium]
MGKGYWLVKSEADCFSIADLERSNGKTTAWDGVRNFQARNYLRSMKRGDLLLFYHSSAEPPGVAGVAEVVAEAHADATALDPADSHYDPRATPEEPIWFCPDVRHVRTFERVIDLAELRAHEELSGMAVLRKGQRLSVMPVAKEEFERVLELAGSRAQAPRRSR